MPIQRFAGQSALAAAPVIQDSLIRSDLNDVLLAARSLATRKVAIGLPGAPPSVELVVSSPGLTSLVGDAPLGPSARELVYDPPEIIASLSFDRLNAMQRAAPGTLQQIAASLPEVLHDAGLRPGDVLTANPEGIRRGDWRRALSFMQYGAGPVDALGQQRARINDDYSLSPLLMYQADPAFAQRLGW